MHWTRFLALALAVPSSAIVRFACSQLAIERLDPLVNPGSVPSSHVHQIVGGVSKTAPIFKSSPNYLLELVQREYGSLERYARGIHLYIVPIWRRLLKLLDCSPLLPRAKW
jgi:hypothetical protein